MKKRSNLPRRAGATVLATFAHLMALLVLGSKIPQLSAPRPAEDRSTAVEVTLVRPQVPPRAPPAAQSPHPPPSTPRASQRVLIAPTPGAPTLSAPSKPEVAQGPPDCAPEDLPLLTDAEKARCRNPIDADKERSLAREADERAAKEVANAKRGPQTYRMDADKEAHYDEVAQVHAHEDAVAKANAEQGFGPPAVGHGAGVGVTCSHVSIPLLGGVETNPNLVAKKHKQERPPHGTSPCSAGLD